MMIQGAVLGAVGAVIAILIISLGFCVNDNLNQRANFTELTAKVEAANKHNKEVKDERETKNKQTTSDSNTRYVAMRTNLLARLGIMHDDRNKWLDKQYPQSGKDAKGLPPICFNRGEFNRSQRDSEQESGRLSEQGERFRLEIKEARDWASRQPWLRDPKRSGDSNDGGGGEGATGSVILEFIEGTD